MRNNEFNELIDLNIPPPPDYKGELYLDLIEFEYDKILISIDEYFNNNAKNSLKEYSTKNIQKLKKLWQDVRHYKKIIVKGEELDYTKSNDFVIEILQVFLERIIYYLLETFKPYIKDRLLEETKNLLISDKVELMTKVREWHYILLAKEYKEKTGFNLPWSVTLFESEREEISKLPNINDRLIRYNDYLIFWKREILSEPILYGDNEINKRMIPLIENEIENLEYQLNLSANTENEELSVMEEPESVDDDINDKPRINFKKEVTEFVNIMIETKILDINDKYFVRDAKKKLIAELDVKTSAANRESIRTYLSNIKGSYKREIKRGKRKKK